MRLTQKKKKKRIKKDKRWADSKMSALIVFGNDILVGTKTY